ncbi:peroxiredoxin, partial [Pseudomonas sp. CCC2.2]|uniref:peroxiredoxin n=1 Tax=Pseudomonas sp. CCC2.2 TaxID=3048605 RepID=UPI002B235A3F
STAIKGKYGLVFFYPLDFTFVCPSELIALDHRIPEFQARNVEVVAVSIDSHFTHNALRNTPVNNGGIGQVKYTMAADINHAICKAYDVETEGGVALRGAFLIDDKGVVRSQIVNDLPLG